MKKSNAIYIFIPLLIAIGALSLPKHINVAIQEKGGAFVSSFFSFFQIKTAGDPDNASASAITSWFQSQEGEKNRATASQAIPYPFVVGKVIFRSIDSWSNFLWIDIGSAVNQRPGGRPIVCKNSPVLSGDSVVGVIDYVGPNSSLVRLITDSALTPAVRVARGSYDVERVDYLLKELKCSLSLFSLQNDEKAKIYTQLTLLQQKLPQGAKKLLLAKGELQGHGEPLYRSQGSHLKGVGFNYDWDDRSGPARDLRSASDALPIIQVNDLLVTSGLDGVFPEGLPIARVISIAPLSEGAIAYEIEAQATAPDLPNIKYVSVIAPIAEREH